MNEKEKIMINSYFDGELDESEKLLAEALLKDDNEARKFYEGLKQLDNYLDTFEKNSFTAAQRKEALDFAESLKSKAENKFPNNFWIPIFQNSWINPSGITMARTGLALSFAFSTKPLSFSAKPKSIFSSSSMSVFVIGLLFLSLLIDILLS